MTSNQIHVIISTPHGIYLDQKANIVTFRTTEGEIGLMAGATSFMAAVIPSIIQINWSNASDHFKLYVGNGIVQFQNDVLSFIVNEVSDKPIEEAKLKHNDDISKYTIIEEVKIKKNLVQK
ncbi:ATP synthase subunit epsilon [Metamycoplasma cloacale]|uniref:ATP synthase epsilon chain n=1 Tax=Metamycoplasma cloacale TaxID=92401 RepID=A0A2Z4LLR9_9BACT|nr:ATP synthase subunit epsilon [Metamycoplasma cloacale]AWX42683.1 F0F1 ATP synthase subunit epsilon [Metamycoplasma cloacale]VEU79505.1 ATP synthase subunit epsilon [Metamycoplasma cloacale]